ncbi:MAG: putative Zn-dependent protease [Oleiphilaceae bacterium]|jgi:predicted Zn-dependent protease
MTHSKYLINTCLLAFSLFISACSLNPVTGKSELLLPSKATDYQIGQSQYKPAQQSQGGAYLLDPKLSTYVASVGKKLATVSDDPKLPYEFVVLNNSVPNAWALPSGKIAINRGLLLQLKDEAQLAAVLGHEIVHAAARHGAQRMRNQQFIQLGLAGLGVAVQDNDYRSLVIGGAALGAQLTSAKYGRGNELESDEYGMKYMAKAGYDLQAAVELQEIFLGLSKQGSSSWIDGLFASHPPSAERVLKNIEHAANLSHQTGYRGEQAYQNATQYIRTKAPAYDLANKAAKALAENRTSEAETFIQQAIEIEPNEALFHSLAGSIYQAKGNNDLALTEHNKAIKLNPEQFSYYLARGQSFAVQDKANSALVDFEQSMSLLPTSTALSYINSLSAKKYY